MAEGQAGGAFIAKLANARIGSTDAHSSCKGWLLGNLIINQRLTTSAGEALVGGAYCMLCFPMRISLGRDRMLVAAQDHPGYCAVVDMAAFRAEAISARDSQIGSSYQGAIWNSFCKR